MPAAEKPPTPGSAPASLALPVSGGVGGNTMLSVTPVAPGGGPQRPSTGAWREDQGPRSSTNPGGAPTKSDEKTKEPPKKLWFKTRLQHTRWYHSKAATSIRHCLNGKHYAVVMVICLLLALFMTDLWVIFGMNSDTEIDVVLTLVMIFFAVELLCLSVTDATYFGSFFFFMDIVGTCSMAYDISYLAGESASQEKFSTNSDAASQFMMLRASRAAKIGARAGRLSRLLRVLRFLPFFTNGKSKMTEGTMATLLNNQLANVLATRVACLTIILVMCIPMFDVLITPTDHSLQAWVDKLSQSFDGDGFRVDRRAILERELAMLTEFYARYDHEPFMACAGQSVGDQFLCNDGGDVLSDLNVTWSPNIGAPDRRSSALLVYSNDFIVGWNMFKEEQLVAGMAMANISFIVFIMIFSGLTLSNIITELAVRPLERMLTTVRQIATTVFKFSVQDEDEDQGEDEAYDINSASEMKLLEKVVQKLAKIAELQAQKDVPEHTEDMEEEDIGILSMMRGQNVVEETTKQARRSMAVARKSMAVRSNAAPQMRLEDCGVTQEAYESWAFNALTAEKHHQVSLAQFTLTRFHEAGEGYITTSAEEATLQKFLQACLTEYPANPFHNFAHAADVVYGTARIMQLIESEDFLTDLEQFSLLVAAVGHDLGHPGVNNGFLTEVGHELALQYNDRSPLENMHCAKLYSIVAIPETNIFANLSKDQFREVRKHCIEVILHTDMMGHMGMVKDLNMTYEMNSEVFKARIEEPEGMENLPGGGGSSGAEQEVFNQPETKALVMNAILHSADVSNPCRTWAVTKSWAHACLEEFFAQGDREKMLGIPVQFLNDRDKLNKPNSQIGFIEFMIAPFFVTLVRLWPRLWDLGENCGANIQQWQELWVEEVQPAEEDRDKVIARAKKVQDNFLDAKNRRSPPKK